MNGHIQETRLESGLTILTDQMPGVRSATLGFFFRTGARDEPTEFHGISHFIEHTVFKGTQRRSALDIAIEQERLGGNLDAFTSHEEIGFAIKVIDDQLPQAFDLIADMLANPRFDDTDLEAEQRVIIEEMKMIDDSPEEYLGEIFSEAFFPDHPLGRSIAGTPSSVKSFNREVTRNYQQSVFTPANLVIAAAGNVDHEEISKLASADFASITDEHSLVTTSSDDRPPITATPFFVKNRPDLQQAHLIIATPFTAATDERRYAADLLANIIGGGTASRLWQKVREDRGLAYSVGASASMHKDCGLFSIFAATSPEHMNEVVDLSIGEIRNVLADGITADELSLAKQQSRASILMSLEDSASRASALAQCEITYGRQISVNETLEKIDAVTTGDVHTLAQEFFRTKNIAFGALGDLKTLTVDRERLRIT